MKSKLLTLIACLGLCLTLAMSETAEYAPPGYVSGCKMVYVTSNTITITAGKLSDSTDSQYIVLPTNVLVDITKVGDNGLDSGSEASNIWYSVYIAVATNQTVVGVLSTNMTSPAGYTVARMVACIRNNAAKDIRPFIQRWSGLTRSVDWDTPPADTRALLNGNSTTNFMVDLSDFVPPTASSVKLQYSFSTGAAGSDTDSLKIKADGLSNATLKLSPGSVITKKMTLNGDVATSSAQKIVYIVDNTNNAANIIVKGYYDEL